MATQKFFPYTRQWIDESDIAAVAEALQEPMITRGPKVEEWEKSVANWCGALHAVAFSSGTAALHAAYWAAKVGPFDRVVTTPNSYIGTLTGALSLGAKVEMADIDPTTGNLDLERMLTPSSPTRGKLVYVPVHFGGAALDMRRFNRLILQPEAVVIEDAAHAFGATYANKKRVGCCENSDMTVFSFHPAKTITTGEGGMVLTNDAAYAERLHLFRNNGLEGGLVEEPTGNFHLSSFAAALGLSQLQRLPTILRKRRALVRLYRKLLAEQKHLRLMSDAQDKVSAHHLFVVGVDFAAVKKSRDQVREELKERGVGTQVHYVPLYHHPVLKRSAESSEAQFPGMEEYFGAALSLPLYVGLTEGNVKKIVSVLAEVLG